MKKTKEQIIQEHLEKPYEVGERVDVRGLGIQNKNNWGSSAKIEEIDETGVFIMEYKQLTHYNFEDIRKQTDDLGHYPFPKHRDKLEKINFTLYSIIHQFEREGEYEIGGQIVKSVDWNPFVYLKSGKKKYYQRDNVWQLETKIQLIKSIINGISCGLVVIRERSWEDLEEMSKAGETQLSFRDVVDGKQRLSALLEFVNDGFEVDGYLYSEWSVYAQRHFGHLQPFAYGTLREDTTDREVIEQFLKVNVAGVPQQKEHLEFVENILEQM